MSPDVIPTPAWLAGVGALPLTGAARVLGRLNGEPHVVALCVSRDEEPGEVAQHYPRGNALHVAGPGLLLSAVKPAEVFVIFIALIFLRNILTMGCASNQQLQEAEQLKTFIL